jgi:hypothetical protein
MWKQGKPSFNTRLGALSHCEGYSETGVPEMFQNRFADMHLAPAIAGMGVLDHGPIDKGILTAEIGRLQSIHCGCSPMDTREATPPSSPSQSPRATAFEKRAPSGTN